MKFLARIIPVAGFVPMLAFAQGAPQLTGFTTFIGSVINFINGTLVPLVFAIAFIVFLYGVFKTFILGGGEEEKQAEGKKLMLYAIIGFVVMLSLWGLVNWIGGVFGLTGQTITLPQGAPGTR